MSAFSKICRECFTPPCRTPVISISRLRSASVGIEMPFQTLPAFEVFVLEFGGLQCVLGWTANKAGFEHEGKSVAEIARLEIGLRRFLEALGVGTVAAHAIVQARPAGQEALCLRIVFSANQAHELIHEIAMEPRWAEGMLGNHPARRENYEVAIGGARNFRRRSQHGVDGGIRMVEADAINAVEPGQVVLVGRVVAVPGDDIERRMIVFGFPKVSEKLGDYPEVAFAVLVASDWRKKVTGIGEAVGADGTEIR